jgi:hypothetical protein
VVVVVAVGVFVAAQSGGNGRQLIVHAPPPGLAGLATENPTTTVTASTGDVAPVTATTAPPIARTTIPAAASPTTATTRRRTAPTSVATTLPNPGTITLTGADNGHSVHVPQGTMIDVQLNGDSTWDWPTEPSSTDGAVVQHLSGSSSPTSSHATFVALSPGTAQLTATGGPACTIVPPTTAPEGCATLGYPWTVTVQVS